MTRLEEIYEEILNDFEEAGTPDTLVARRIALTHRRDKLQAEDDGNRRTRLDLIIINIEIATLGMEIYREKKHL